MKSRTVYRAKLKALNKQHEKDTSIASFTITFRHLSSTILTVSLLFPVVAGSENYILN